MDSSRESRGSVPRHPDHPAPASARASSPAAPSSVRPSGRTPTRAAPATRHTPSAADTAFPQSDCAAGSFPQPPHVLREPPFFEQVFRQLEPHRHVADLRLEPPQLPLLEIEGPDV